MVKKIYPGCDLQFPVDELCKQHPQLTEKAVFDYVNGLEILGDHLRLRNQINNSFFLRTWSSITGQTAQRQQAIDLNVTTSLNTVSIWLQELQRFQAESDLTIAHLADKLVETREGIMRLKDKHQSLFKHIQIVDNNLDKFQIQVNRQLVRLKSDVEYLLASAHLQQVFDKWKAGRLNHYPPLARLFLVIDELYWGKFGTFCRISSKADEVDKLKKQLADKLLIQMNEDLDGNVSRLMLIQQWFSPIQSLPDYLRDVLIYLSDWAQPQTTPVIWAMRNAALPENYFLKPNEHLPHVLSGQQAINHLIHENKKR